MRSLLFILPFISTLVSAQQVRVPDLPGIFTTQTLPLINPATGSEVNKKSNLLFVNKQGLGVFSIFRQNYFNVNYTINKDSVSRHGVGVRVINDKAGKYIGINRLAAQYNYSTMLNQNLRMSLGIAPTFISYRKEAQSFGGSDNTGNLDIGAWIGTSNMSLGVSANQLIPVTLVVIDEIDSLKSYYSFFSEYKVVIGSNYSLKLRSLYVVNQSQANFIMLGSSVQYLSNYVLSVNYEFTRNIVIQLGVDNIKLSKSLGLLNLYVAYTTPSSRNVYRPRGGIEWLINYNF